MLAPGADHIGEVQAWNVDTGKRVWTHTYRDVGRTGARCWRPAAGWCSAAAPTIASSTRSTRRPASCCGSSRPTPASSRRRSSFTVDGKQYIAVQSGWGVDARGMQSRLNTLTRRVPRGAGGRRDLGVRATGLKNFVSFVSFVFP